MHEVSWAAVTIRKTFAYAAAALLPLLLTTACSFTSDYGPVNSAHFNRTVEKSLGNRPSGKIYESLRARWIPYKQKKPTGGIFITTSKGMVFATWNDTAGRYRPRYTVTYNRLSTVRLKKDGFQKRLRVETRNRRVDYFEILTQGKKPPYVVNNDLTESVFELLKKIKSEKIMRHRPDNVIKFDQLGKRKLRKRRASEQHSKRRRTRAYYYDY